MLARILRVEVGADRTDAVVDRYRESVRPIHARARGLLRHYVLADGSSGRMAFIGIWESQAALDEVARELEPVRARLWREFAESPTLDAYEVVDEL